MLFHWSCFIVSSCLEICSFIAILVCQKKNKKTKKKQKKKHKKKKTKQKKKRKEKIYINKCARICIQYKYSLSSYVGFLRS